MMGENGPVVSVVIPAYRNAQYVNQALESVRAQTFGDHETIVVDDGSGDEFVSNYNIGDDVQLVRHACNRGPAAARNTGIREAKGRYVAFLDMDDVWLPGKLEKQVRAMEQDSAIGLVYCHCTLVDECLGDIPNQPRPKPITHHPFKRLLKSNVIKSCSVVLVRREALDRCGAFDEQITGADDWDLWIRIARQFGVFMDPLPLALYRVHASQLSRHRTIMRASEVAVRERWLEWATREMPEWLGWLRWRLSSDLGRLSKCQSVGGDTAAALASLRRAAHVCPSHPITYLRMLNALLPFRS